MIGILLKKSGEEIAKAVATAAAVGLASDAVLEVIRGNDVEMVVKKLLGGAVSGTTGSVAQIIYDEVVKEANPAIRIGVGLGGSVVGRFVYDKAFMTQTQEQEEE